MPGHHRRLFWSDRHVASPRFSWCGDTRSHRSATPMRFRAASSILRTSWFMTTAAASVREQADSRLGVRGEGLDYYSAAIRELFEESGVLLANPDEVAEGPGSGTRCPE